MPGAIELPRRYGLVVGMLLAGVLFVFAGIFELGRVSVAAEVFFFALGAPLVIANGRILIAHSPRLRATASGLWFGGGAVVPWAEVKRIYEARASAIAIDFEHKRVLFRLPMTLWLAAPFSAGDVDIAPVGSTPAIVARLEAMRGAARAA